jgi:hypothetical protein
MGVEGFKDVEPNPEPNEEPSDPHRGPLDDPEDARFLDEHDDRRLAVDKQREEHNYRRLNPQIPTAHEKSKQEQEESEPEEQEAS